MRFDDTSLWPGENRFPETTQGLLSDLMSGTEEDIRQGLDQLCRRYWRAVYAFVRLAWAKSTEDAKDLTQAFFLRLLEGEALRAYEPERASFHRYLKLLLRRFVINQDETSKRLKRGGAFRVASLDGIDAQFTDLLADPNARSPEHLFDALWRVEVLREALQRLEDKCRVEQRLEDFHIYEAFALSEPAERPTYAALAARFGRTERQIELCLTALREEIRREIRSELSRLSCGHLEEEWNDFVKG